jgi:hypothetical protein
MRESRMRPTQTRLEEAEKKIFDPSFIQRKRSTNDIGYYVFDYPAEDELIVREWVQYIQRKSNTDLDGFSIAIFDIYDIMINVLEDENILEQCYGFEEKQGINRVVSAVGRVLRLSDDEGLIVEYIRNNMPVNAIAIIAGVGKCYPVLRAYKVLHSLHQMLVKIPVVLLYPGKYGDKELALFGNDVEPNYYWVNRLVEN